MNNKLTNEEIAKVFAMYFETVTYEWYISSEDLNVATVDGKTVKFISEGKHTGTPKMRLTPLNKISNEHCNSLRHVCNLFNNSDNKDISFSLSHEFEDMPYQVNQQLILWGYAVPLFFGLNHWANGKTAIELDIAVAK